ncbi:MAG: signal peptide peptidase SppA [Dehalococcoidia bacterium]
MGTQLRSLFLLLANGATYLINRARLAMAPVRGYVVLDIKGTYPERRPPVRSLPLRLLLRSREEMSVEVLTERLDRIAEDPRTEGVVLRFGQLDVDLSTADSMRRAVSRFRKSGKRAVVYFTTDMDLRNYYAASTADLIAAPESAQFVATGMSIQVQFFKDALERWGMQADVERMAEYKTAASPFIEKDLTEPHREMLDSLLDSIFGSVVQGIAQSRELDEAEVKALLDKAPHPAERAQEAKLIDAVLYEDELAGYLGKDQGRSVELAPWRTAGQMLVQPYLPSVGGEIGVIAIRGAIVQGESRDVPAAIPLVGGAQAGSDTVIRALRQAARDPNIKAVVCYVESPGGSALASDLIWREIQRLDARKPVVAYMGSVAGSGGYYVAVGARHIVARPQTLTGSIGVLLGKLVLGGLMKKAGIGSALLTRGRRAALFTAERPFNDDERQAMRESLVDIYERFKARVAGARRFSSEAVEERARGRVWTGLQALEQGLADEIGDMQTAVARAKVLAGIPESRRSGVVDVMAPNAPMMPLLDKANALTGLPEHIARLNRERCWAYMPWTISVE